MLMRISQRELGDVLAVKFQQVQKYESGENRIGAGALALIADALDVPVSYFFEGASQKDAVLQEIAGDSIFSCAAGAANLQKFMRSKAGAALYEHFSSIPDPFLQACAFELIESLAAISE